MADASIDWSQLDGLAVDLGKAGEQVQGLASQVIRAGAADVEREAKKRAPVRTGNLKNSIGFTTPGELTAEIGPTASYGIYLEYGTRRMAARPYLGPALDAVEPSLVAAFEQLGGTVLGGDDRKVWPSE